MPGWGPLELVVDALGGDVETFRGLWISARRRRSKSVAKSLPGKAALKVLAVDDHRIFRESRGGLLRSAGHHVSEAGGGEEAVKLAASARPQLVIMDV